MWRDRFERTSSCSGHSCKKGEELFFGFTAWFPFGALFHDHYVISVLGQSVSLSSEGVPDNSFPAISDDRVPGLFTDRNAQTGRPFHFLKVQYHELLARKSLSLLVAPIEIGCLNDAAGSPQSHPSFRRHFEAVTTVRRFRPFRRRRLKMARPPLLLIRSRNPWVRFWLTLLG